MRTRADKIYFRVAECRAEAGKMVSALQILDLRGGVEAHRRESLREAGTRAVPGEGVTAGTGDLGGAKGGQAAASGYDM